MNEPVPQLALLIDWIPKPWLPLPSFLPAGPGGATAVPRAGGGGCRVKSLATGDWGQITQSLVDYRFPVDRLMDICQLDTWGGIGWMDTHSLIFLNEKGWLASYQSAQSNWLTYEPQLRHNQHLAWWLVLILSLTQTQPHAHRFNKFDLNSPIRLVNSGFKQGKPFPLSGHSWLWYAQCWDTWTDSYCTIPVTWPHTHTHTTSHRLTHSALSNTHSSSVLPLIFIPLRRYYSYLSFSVIPLFVLV